MNFLNVHFISTWWLHGKESACNAGATETRVWFLGQEDPLEEGMATHSSILTWRIPMDRGAWQATVHGVANCRTWLNDLACTCMHHQHQYVLKFVLIYFLSPSCLHSFFLKPPATYYPLDPIDIFSVVILFNTLYQSTLLTNLLTHFSFAKISLLCRFGVVL